MMRLYASTWHLRELYPGQWEGERERGGGGGGDYYDRKKGKRNRKRERLSKRYMETQIVEK